MDLDMSGQTVVRGLLMVGVYKLYRGILELCEGVVAQVTCVLVFVILSITYRRYNFGISIITVMLTYTR